MVSPVGGACLPRHPDPGCQPKHIATLKRLAEEVGIRVPIWTATGWGNAQLPVPEVFPVYSGYSEGFWVDAEDEWD